MKLCCLFPLSLESSPLVRPSSSQRGSRAKEEGGKRKEEDGGKSLGGVVPGGGRRKYLTLWGGVKAGLP